MASKKPPTPQRMALDEVRARIGMLRALLPSLSRVASSRALEELHSFVEEIESVRDEHDPIKDPRGFFDPSNPDTTGRVVTLALLAQARIPLGRIARSYGSGVYAIYYTGDHPTYSAVSDTETPVYVGKADPARPDARTAREQGPQLFSRLADHRRMIRQVSTYAVANGLPHQLRIEDFQCRRLVCATNAQLVAEKHLIGTFRPIWNSEVKIAFGISKHGDDAETRKNGRSPWDVLHPGRPWALRSTSNQVTERETLSKLATHFYQNPPYRSVEDVMRVLLASFTQNAPVVPETEIASEVDSESSM